MVGDKVLRTIWLSRLLAYIQPHLMTRTADSNEKLADIADAIVDTTRASAFQVVETARYPVPPAQSADDPGFLETKLEIRLA